MSSTTNTSGYILKDAEFNQLSVDQINGAKQQFVLVGDSGAMTVAAATGTIGAHDINALGTTTALVVPAGVEVYKSELRVVVAPTDAGATGTISFGTDGVGDAAVFNTAETVNQFTLAGYPQCGDVTAVFTCGSVTDETIQYTVATENITAGQIFIYLYCRQA